MNPAPTNTAHSLYMLYETLPDDLQQAFLQELIQKKHQELVDLSFYLDCKQTKDENEYLTEQEHQMFINSLSQCKSRKITANPGDYYA
nr:hypothetical protein [Crenothrix polyspora]